LYTIDNRWILSAKGTVQRKCRKPGIMAKAQSTKDAPLVGCWITTPSHWACEVAAAVGYDAVFVDLEHGTISLESADRMIAVGRSIGLRVYVRVGGAERVPIQQALDAGAHGLVLPQIEDLAHARRSAAYAKYPRLGSRGMGTPRSQAYVDTPPDFVERENRATQCLVMIETPGALRDVKEIAALETVDGLFMGPYDLSLTRGRGQYAVTEADRQDARAIAAAAKSAGKIVGLPLGSTDDRAFSRSIGADITTVADDIFALKAGLADALEKLGRSAT
jgi:2-keto-3-deoxy-L-rhamnonate aldolase RhmA